MKLKNLTISKRMWLLTAMFTLLVIVVGSFGAWNTIRLSRELDRIGHVDLAATRDMTLVDMYHDGLAAKVYKALEYATQDDKDRLLETKKEIEEMAGNMNEIIDEFARLPLNSKTIAEIEDAKPSIDAYIKATQLIVSTAATKNRKEALASMSEFEAAFKDLEGRFEKLGDDVETDVKQRVDNANKIADQSQLWNIAIILGCVITGLMLSAWSVRDIFRTLTTIARAFSTGATKLAEVSAQIEVASSGLAESTTEQSSAIEETVSSMEQMGSMIAQTNQNAELTTREADQSVAKSHEGRQAIATMVESMKNIAAANDRLNGIVTVIEDIKSKTRVINDIAFETRLLAFNASIEAARAGAHGRGFAVVAEEVGKLANVSGKAADEIRLLLENSVADVTSIVAETRAKVDDGHAKSQSCEQAFANMERSIGEITHGIQKIAAATKEQDSGVRQTNIAMNEMEKVTQANSTNAERSFSHASDLRLTAAQMQTSTRDMHHLVLGFDGQESPDSSHAMPSGPSSPPPDSPVKPKNPNKLVRNGDSSTEVEMSEEISRNDSRWHAA